MPLYIGSFSFQRQRFHKNQKGEFQVLANATDFNDAIEKFREQIDHTRATSPLLSGKVKIILERIIEVSLPSSKSALVNFQAQDVDMNGPAVIYPIPNDSDGKSLLVRGTQNASSFAEKSDILELEFMTYQD